MNPRSRRNFFRHVLTYLVLVGLPVLAVIWLLTAYAPRNGGASTSPPPDSATAPAAIAPFDLVTLIVQLVTILIAARVVGYAFRRIRQPQVVGEMAAGLLLGPSVFGALMPGTFAAVFPAASLGYLNALAQLGLLLFMFLVGLEFDPKLLRGRGQTAVITSHASITLPFLLGVTLALYLFPRLAPDGTAFTSFALFMGAAMSVTAFPVLARILVERQLTHTRVGVVALACAAVDDVTAWCMLAVVIMVVRASAGHAPLWLTLGGTVAFAAVMLGLVRPLVRRAFARQPHAAVNHDRVAILLLFAFLSALLTERIGIHALFGAFMAGAVLPREEPFVRAIVARLEDLTVVFLLPLFFAFTGLRTALNGISGDLWGVAALIIAAAIAGKLFGSALAARLTGMHWREALGVGVLMNTRGLMELVILNVGLDIGVLSTPLFSIMVAMALVTTLMTAPLLDLLSPSRAAP